MGKIKIIFILALTLLFSGFVNILYAQILLDEISVTSSKTPVELSKVGSSVKIFNKEQLDASGELFLMDFLNNVAGVSVDQNGPSGMLSGINIRGSSSKYTKILIDGIDITNTSSTQATPYLSSFLISDIERIEVLKGSQSALYGSQAIGGVISITSKTPKKSEINNVLSAEYGSFSTSVLNYSFENRTENNDLVVKLQKYDSDGFSAAEENNGATEKDGYNNTNLNINSTHFVNESLTLNFGGFNLKEKGDFDAFGPSDSSEYYFKEDASGVHLGANLVGSAFNHTVDYSYFSSDRKNYGPNSWDNYTAKGKRTVYSYKSERDFSKKYNLIGGIDYTEDAATISSQDKSSSLTGLFIENIYNFNNNLTSTFGLRQDSHSKFGGQTVYRGTLAYSLDDTIYRSSYGTGYRAPSLYELFATTFGNTSLQPEASSSFDIGFETKLPTLSGKLNGTLFRSTIKDRIDFSGGGYKQVTTKEERQGAELDVSFPISPNMKTNISYTHTTDSDGNHVRKVPKDKLSLNLNSKISKNIEGFFEYKYAKDLKDVVMLGDYSVLNTKFIYSLQNGINLNLKIENLLDEEYQVVNGYGTSDRAFYIGLDGAF